MDSQRFGVTLSGALRWTLLILLVLTPRARAQERDGGDAAQAVSETGLLPVYGVDFHFDPSWVDASRFPSESTEHPHSGVSETFQKLWEALSPSGFNTVRFPVDTGDPEAAARRVANLCRWGIHNGVNLIPVLKDVAGAKAIAPPFADRAAAFAQAVVEALKSGDGQHLESFTQILAYQLEDGGNHAALKGGISPQKVQEELVRAAALIRENEEKSLEELELGATPLMVNTFLDSELIKLGAMAGATLGEQTYLSAYAAATDFLAPLLASADIDVIGIRWLAGSLSAGGVERFPSLLRTLTSEVADKLVIFTTGFSTGFHPAEDQREYYMLAFANLADYRANEGIDSPFIGVIFHEAFSRDERDPAAPTPDLPTRMKQWAWESKAPELVGVWTGEAVSEEVSWWLRKVENNMGLLAVDSTGSEIDQIAAQPGQESLEEIASTVSEASAGAGDAGPEFAPEADESMPQGSGAPGSGFGEALQQVGQQYLLVVLDRLFDKLDGQLTGESEEISSVEGDFPAEGAENETLSITLVNEEVAIHPPAPRVDDSISFTFTVHNQNSESTASGLVVALADEIGALAYLEDVEVGPSETLPISLDWTPAEEGSYQLWVQVYDEWLTAELASVALDPLVIGAAGGSEAATAGVSFSNNETQISPSSPLVGSPVSFSLSVQNQSAQESAPAWSWPL